MEIKFFYKTNTTIKKEKQVLETSQTIARQL